MPRRMTGKPFQTVSRAARRSPERGTDPVLVVAFRSSAACEIKPGRGEAYIWNCATDPRHRQKGFFRAIVRGIVDQARKEGLARVWIGTLDIPAANAMTQAGFVPAMRFTTVWMYGVRWLRVRAAPGVDRGLLTAARKALAIVGRPLRIGSSMKRAERRRH